MHAISCTVGIINLPGEQIYRDSLEAVRNERTCFSFRLFK